MSCRRSGPLPRSALKRDAAAGDDGKSTKDEPAEKSRKKKEDNVEKPLPSQEVLELRQKVAKLESDYHGACQIAGVSQARIEFLEELLDKKPDTQVLERAIAEKTLADDLQKKLSETTTQLEEMRREAEINRLEKKLLDELQKKVASLTQQLETEKSRAQEDRTVASAKIDELTRKLDKCNEELERARDDQLKEHTPRLAETPMPLIDPRREAVRRAKILQIGVNVLGPLENERPRASEEQHKRTGEGIGDLTHAVLGAAAAPTVPPEVGAVRKEMIPNGQPAVIAPVAAPTATLADALAAEVNHILKKVKKEEIQE